MVQHLSLDGVEVLEVKERGSQRGRQLRDRSTRASAGWHDNAVVRGCVSERCSRPSIAVWGAAHRPRRVEPRDARAQFLARAELCRVGPSKRDESIFYFGCAQLCVEKGFVCFDDDFRIMSLRTMTLHVPIYT